MSCSKGQKSSACSSGVYTVRRVTLLNLCVGGPSNTWPPFSLLMQGSSTYGCVYSLSIGSPPVQIPATGCSPLCNITVTVNAHKNPAKCSCLNSLQFFACTTLWLITWRLPVCVQTPACCKGFYGPDCSPCPGGYQTPCSGHGQVRFKTLIQTVTKHSQF